jgi:hypothetical protein
MRRTAVLLAAALAMGCSVPDVTFLSDAAAADGGDGGDGSGGDAPSDGANDADAEIYCVDGGDPPDGGFCCSPGVVCFGNNCNVQNCLKCVNLCGASMICCAKGNMPTCQMAPPPCL